ncbi:MAG: tRNA (adenosine(37)-N6)-threonylcarbamoyltransferase complex dimerization subunit type 1 TsaB [Syntrophorhabdaceae bacterium]|nr:tRNA (adenosine(37)-N6)-threonylcarbamoyltransferase complex dimerization subunit type 1 TsaB [Syntrophorhabdaceae bacterium]
MENRLILGVDNSLDYLTVVVASGDSIVEERHISNRRPPSQILPALLSEMLKSNGYSIHDIGHIVVTLGPGSFTGIRVALAFVKGLNAGAKIPLIGIPTLDVLASFYSSFDGYYICPVIDAKKGEVFTALYRSYKGTMENIKPYSAIKIHDIKDFIETPCILFGRGTERLKRTFSASEGVILVEKGFSMINGEVLIREGLRRIEEGRGTEIKPIYCRKSEAEIKFDISVT